MRASETAVRSVARSHVGRVRQINEDRVLDAPARGLWAVADGMGGHSGGDIAAAMVIAALQALPEPASDEAIADALHEASRAIRDHAAGTRDGSGSTVVGLSLTDGAATIFWVGDSRAYRLRDGVFEQLSHDHSVVQQLVDAGVLAADRAHSHPHAHIITQALGTGEAAIIERVRTATRPGDVYLLCSDGLSRELDDASLREALLVPRDDVADRLMAGALAAGGRDNISLIIVTI